MCIIQSYLGRFQASHESSFQAYEASLEVHGHGDIKTINFQYGIAVSLGNPKKYDESIALFEKVLEHQDANEQDLVLTLDAISGFLSLRADHKTAMHYIERAIEANRKNSNEIGVINCLISKASVLRKMQKHTEAAQLLQEGLQQCLEWFGKEPARVTCRCIRGLGELMHEQGSFTGAERLHRSCLRDLEIIHGKDHPETMHSYFELAMALEGCGNHSESELLNRQVLKYRVRLLGLKYPDTFEVMNNLRSNLCNLGRLEEAMEMAHRLLSLQKEVNGPNDERTLDTQSTMVEILLHTGKHKEAGELSYQTLKVLREIHKHDNGRISHASSLLATCFVLQGEFQETEKCLKEFWVTLKEVMGKNDVMTLRCQVDIAETLFYQQRNEQGMDILNGILEELEHHHPEPGHVALLQHVQEVYEHRRSTLGNNQEESMELD